MNTCVAHGLCKSYGDVEAVRDVSFTVAGGEIFGLVGPNGAGKTTTIRMLMDIIKPDSGTISILGEPLQESTKDRIGYLPEERGLYRKLDVWDTLLYLAALKNVGPRLAQERASSWLQRVGMLPHKRKKINELSRGMGQLIQFIVTVIHDPELVIFDEPFAGLDPVNTQLVKEVILELKAQGKTIMLSTHMMNQVEELCDRILMIDGGRSVLYGDLAEIKRRFRSNSVLLQCAGPVGEIEGIIGRRDHGSHVELFLDEDTTPQQVLEALVSRGVGVERFEVSTPSLNEIFIQVAQQER